MTSERVDLRPHFVTAKQLLLTKRTRDGNVLPTPSLTPSQEEAVLARMPDRQRLVLMSIRAAGSEMKQVQDKLNDALDTIKRLRIQGDAIQHYTAILALPDHKHVLGQDEWWRMTRAQRTRLRELFNHVMLPTKERLVVVLLPNNRPHDRNEVPVVVRPFVPPPTATTVTWGTSSSLSSSSTDEVPETDSSSDDASGTPDNDDYVPQSPEY